MMSSKPPVALFSPVNPVRSGVSDYTEALVPFLSERFTVDLFIEDYSPSSEMINRMCRIHHFREFEYLNLINPYERIVYQIGNNTIHNYMYSKLFRHPGIVILHETNLHMARAKEYLQKGMLGDYFDEMKYCHGESGVKTGWLIAKGYQSNLLYDQFPMLTMICQAAQKILVHNSYAVAQIKSYAPGAPVEKIPAPFIDEDHLDKATARTILKMDPSIFMIASFGFIAPGKGLESSLKAFKDFVKIFQDSRYILVGEAIEEGYLKSLLEQIDDFTRARLIVTGYVSFEAFKAYLNAADVCINLRYPAYGEASSALLRIMAAGKPVIIPSYRQFKEFPPSVCVFADIFPSERDSLFQALKILAENPSLCESLGKAAKLYVSQNHNVVIWAAKLLQQISSSQYAEKRCGSDLRKGQKPGHLKSLAIEEHIAMTFFDLRDIAMDELILGPIVKAIEELELDC